MSASVVDRSARSVTIQVTIPLEGSMLENEERIQQELNEAGVLATGEALSRFDADGSPIEVGSVRFTSKGKHFEKYQTPYGETRVKRHVYQSSKGGRTFCPLERDARLLMNSTPRLAKMVSFKYADSGADMVQRDFVENHGRRIARSYIKDLSDFVGSIAQAKEESWNYALPTLDQAVAAVGIGLDGTCMLLRDDGWRQAMAGSISLYTKEGERIHTIYTGAAPEYGKERFREQFAREIERIKATYPKARYVGLADGAADNWAFLAPRVDQQVLDFYHVSEYVGHTAQAIFGRRQREREAWLEDRLHRLKHKQGAAWRLLAEMREYLPQVKSKTRQEALQKGITYFENHHQQMPYGRHVRDNLPIGSGVTEAACKILVKQRLCASGMRWKEQGASAVLAVRCLVLTPGRWGQFWQRINQYGVPA